MTILSSRLSPARRALSSVFSFTKSSFFASSSVTRFPAVTTSSFIRPTRGAIRTKMTVSAPPSTRVKIVEVGPRDGLQNEPNLVPTPTKLSLINRLSSTGLPTIEAGAFVSPKWVPQMGDTPQLLSHLAANPPPRASEITYPYLVPNLVGLQRALELPGAKNGGLKEIAIFASASEGFSRKNINCTIAESLERFKPVLELAKQHNIRVRGYISMIFSCPYDGTTPPTTVAKVAKELLELGCYEISLGDTNGSGTPQTVSKLLETLLSPPFDIPVERLACHFHDTYNTALINAVTALRYGVRVFDSSVAGLGGCPYSKGATGNVATEDLVYALEGAGYTTGVDLEKIAEIGEWISSELGRGNGSKVGPALLRRKRAEREKEEKKAEKESRL